jgi:integrase/recombinase XerD
MSTLAEHAQNYLRLRRALGFKLKGEGVLLAEFVACAEQAGQRTITTEFALSWARRPHSASRNYLSRRLRAVRSFARYLYALDAACEIPSLELLPASKYRPAPYLYRDEEIVALMTAAGALRPPLRAATFRTLIGLLACTGLRIGEALRLDRREDVDTTRGLLSVRDSKFGKSRGVLLHPSTVAALENYGEIRDRLCSEPTQPSFFITTRGTQIAHPTIYPPFRTLLEQAGITHPVPGRHVRVHDLRHSFAVKTLLGWYRDGGDVQARMPLLSTYLGHVDPAATFWYLSAAPELLALAVNRLEHPTGAQQ